MPATSCVVIRLRQAAAREILPVRLVMARSTMPRITAGRGRKASRASASSRVTTRAFGPGLAKAALAARVDGEVVDLERPINADAKLAIVTAKDEADALVRRVIGG